MSEFMVPVLRSWTLMNEFMVPFLRSWILITELMVPFLYSEHADPPARRLRTGAQTAGTSSGRREVERGVVDAVEDVGEGDHGQGQGDIHQLRVGVAGVLDGRELLLVERAAGQDQNLNEAHQGVALGVARGLAGANPLHDVGLQARQLAKQAVGGLAIIAADGRADGGLYAFLILFAVRARGKNGVGLQPRLERGRSLRAAGRAGVPQLARGRLDLGEGV